MAHQLMSKPTHPLLIAQRGNTRDYPENTLEAFASALALGADGIELDVHLDPQGVPIVVHNYTQKLANDLHSQGVTLHTHLAKWDEDDWQRVLDLGLDQCTFDDPQILELSR